jgi:hypothetical protein
MAIFCPNLKKSQKFDVINTFTLKFGVNFTPKNGMLIKGA